MWGNNIVPIDAGIGCTGTGIRSDDGSKLKSEIKSSTCTTVSVPVRAPAPDSLQLPALKDNENIDNTTHPFKLKTKTATTAIKASNRSNYRRSPSTTTSCIVDVENVCGCGVCICRSDTTDEAGSPESALSQNLAEPTESIQIRIQSRPRQLYFCWSDKFTPSSTNFLNTNSKLKKNCNKKSDKFKKNYQRGYFCQEVRQRIDAFKVVPCAKIKMSLKGAYVCLVLFIVMFASVYCLPRDQRNNEIIAVDVDSNSNANSKIVSLSNSDRHSPWNTLDGSPTVLFAHRGEKVLLPEHSLPGYETASILGADYVEPDLCLTKDNVFVCHHDLFLRDGTDVRDHPEFEHLKKLLPDGTYNWYIRDFTLKQLQTLRLIQQKTGIRPQDYNLVFTIPTFQEYLNTIHEMTYKLNKTIGIVPELKNPTFHNSNETEPNFMEKQLLEVLSFNGYPINEIEQGGHCQAAIDGQSHHLIKCPPVIIQCFEKPSLDYLKDQTEIDLLMLVEIPPLLTYQGMAEIGKVAKYYSPWKEYLYVGPAKELAHNNITWNQTEIDLMGGFIPANQFTLEAHKHGMKVVIWTIHDSREPSTRGCAIVPGCEKENKTEELNYFFNLGVDGIFIENVAESSQIRRNYEMESEMRFKYDQLLKSSGSGGEAHAVKGGNLLTVISCLVIGYFFGNEKLKYIIL